MATSISSGPLVRAPPRVTIRVSQATRVVEGRVFAMRDSIETKVIQDAEEVPLVLHSDVREPLASLSFLRRSLALAELAMIAYNDEAEAQQAARAIGFPDAQLFDQDGSQAYRFRNEHDVVLACRGTEPNQWNDIQADANAVMSVVGTLGNVHSGFN